LGFWDFGISGYRDIGILGFWDIGILGFWDIGIGDICCFTERTNPTK